MTSTSKKESKAAKAVVAGFSLAAFGLIALLSINGQSTVPQWTQMATYLLIAAGLVLPAAGMFWLRSAFVKTQDQVRNGFFLQGLGLLALFFGVAIAVVLSSLVSFLFGAVSLVVSGILLLVGTVSVWKNRRSLGAPSSGKMGYMVPGMALIISGVGVIMASNLAFYYFLSQVQNTVYTDIGSTISAIGCIVTAYSFFYIKYSAI